MRKDDIKRMIDTKLNEWGVPQHLVAVKEGRGKFVVSLLPAGGSELETIEISTGLGYASVQSGLSALQRAIRKGCQRTQTDIEDFCETSA